MEVTKERTENGIILLNEGPFESFNYGSYKNDFLMSK